MKIPKIEYDVYSKFDGIKLESLNKSVCQYTKLSISIPIILSENDNLSKLNSSSEYYNDICHTSTSEDWTDISLKDRKEDFLNFNKTVCKDGYAFIEYDKINQKAKCSCKIKESLNSILYMKMDKSK